MKKNKQPRDHTLSLGDTDVDGRDGCLTSITMFSTKKAALQSIKVN